MPVPNHPPPSPGDTPTNPLIIDASPVRPMNNANRATHSPSHSPARSPTPVSSAEHEPMITLNGHRNSRSPSPVSPDQHSVWHGSVDDVWDRMPRTGWIPPQQPWNLTASISMSTPRAPLTRTSLIPRGPVPPGWRTPSRDPFLNGTPLEGPMDIDGDSSSEYIPSEPSRESSPTSTRRGSPVPPTSSTNVTVARAQPYVLVPPLPYTLVPPLVPQPSPSLPNTNNGPRPQRSRLSARLSGVEITEELRRQMHETREREEQERQREERERARCVQEKEEHERDRREEQERARLEAEERRLAQCERGRLWREEAERQRERARRLQEEITAEVERTGVSREEAAERVEMRRRSAEAAERRRNGSS
ncbi:hypothetical protein BJ165DRAFT_1408935 [Panaeolus papilionaceus]|nr:hypothetical protein BJ165DRAFT_1408935 [Panaeolus papilionaceus]